MIIEMVGLRFGRLLVKSKTETRSKTGWGGRLKKHSENFNGKNPKY